MMRHCKHLAEALDVAELEHVRYDSCWEKGRENGKQILHLVLSCSAFVEVVWSG